MRFDEFMRWALYRPEHGYYRTLRDPFGGHGDFYTASQVQPLFGRLVAAAVESAWPTCPVFELGPGRRELASAFAQPYIGIDRDDPLPRSLSGFVFANEFFDALPVRAGVREGRGLYELLVESREETGEFYFEKGPPLDPASTGYVQRYWPFVPDGGRFEIGAEALEWIDRLARRMADGSVLIIDYGYTTPETVRFPQGTLMSYRGHVAVDSVLARPGEQDITAHVAFDALRDRAEEGGFTVDRFETLAQFTLRVLESQPFLVQTLADRQQLKTLVYGMGETFRCLWLVKKG